MKYFGERTPLTIVEVPPFGRLASAVLIEEELDELKLFLAWNPEAGALIQGTGGVRKVRWTTANKGKRGGVRVIYYYHDDSVPLFLLTVYAKSHKESLTAREKANLRWLARMIVGAYRGRRKDRCPS